MYKTSEIVSVLQEHGVKPSSQRIAILGYLMNNPVHPTADHILKQLFHNIPNLSKTTVYNTLKLLVKHGVVNMLNIDEKNVRYDAVTSEHAHFKCNKCGCLIDVPIQHFSSDICETMGLLVTDYKFYYTGFCKECRDDNVN